MLDLNPKNSFEWLRRARGDLIIAKGFSECEGVLLEDLCFHSQQATEKALKGVLVSLGVDFPRTHSITLLLDIVDEVGIEIPVELIESGRLTFYAVQARYPGAYNEVEYEEYLDAVKIAEKVVCWAQEYIKHNR